MQTKNCRSRRIFFRVFFMLAVFGVPSVVLSENRMAEDKLQSQKIIRMLRPEKPGTTGEDTDSCALLLVKDWKSHKGQFIAAMDWVTFKPATSPGGVDDQHTGYIGVFTYDSNGKSFSLRASGTFPLEYGQELSDLDLAYYRLRAGTIAFGVRTLHNFGYAGGGGMNEDLILFIAEDSAVVEVLSTCMASSSMTAGSWNDDGTRDHSENGSETVATLAMLKSSSGGYFDILKTRDDDKAVFRWNGSTYETSDTDPVEDVNVH